MSRNRARQFKHRIVADVCRRKVAHANRQQAEAALRALVQTSKGGRLNVYQCDVCGLWHVGNKQRRQRGGQAHEIVALIEQSIEQDKQRKRT